MRKCSYNKRAFHKLLGKEGQDSSSKSGKDVPKKLTEEDRESLQKRYIQNIDKADVDKNGILTPEEVDQFLKREEFYKKFYRRGFMRSLDFRDHYSQGNPHHENDSEVKASSPLPVASSEPNLRQLNALFIRSAVPFFGFGFVDNFLMITAGELIDAQLGGLFHLSTLAAAGLGNLLSDVAGIGMGGVIEEASNKLGLPDPRMTIKQLQSPTVRATRHLATVLGIALGCLAGMVPLLFMSSQEKREETLARNLFRTFDVDDDKLLTPTELREGLGKLGIKVSDQQLDSIFDKGRKEAVTFHEFLKATAKS